VSIACVAAKGRGAVDLLFQEVAARLAAEGWRLAGAVQVNCGRDDVEHCDMDIRVLPEGGIYRISQQLGRGSSGCRLNPDALERAVAEATGLWERPDLLIVNKFGKMEGEGRGFRDLIARAVAEGVPVLIGVNGLNRDALEAFLGSPAPLVAAEVGAVLAWAAGQRAAA
jgi:nucleoside-triphosphatase THEP1